MPHHGRPLLSAAQSRERVKNVVSGLRRVRDMFRRSGSFQVFLNLDKTPREKSKPFRNLTSMESPDSTPIKGAAQRQFYRKRFESSVFGEHPMLPPTEVSKRFLSKEEPSKYPTGQDSSFMHMTPMPFRFTEQYVEERKASLSTSPKKKLLPYYQTSSSDVGKLAIEPTDLPMRWYGIRGGFTSSWVAESKTMTNSGLSTSIFRSNVHPT